MRNPSEPHNYFTKGLYKGSNVSTLEVAMEENDWISPAFMTYKQAVANGVEIIRGQEPTMITRWFPSKPKKGQKRRLGSKKEGRLSSVNFYLFNLEQTSLSQRPDDDDDDDDEIEDNYHPGDNKDSSWEEDDEDEE